MSTTDLPRFRDMGSQSPSSMSYRADMYGPTTPFYTSTPHLEGSVQVGCYGGTYKFIADVKHKGFRKQEDPSKWVTGPLTIGAIYVKASNVSATVSNTPNAYGQGWTRTWTGDGVGYLFGPLVPSARSISFGSWADLINIAVAKQHAVLDCANRINGAKSQSLVIIAERKKTVDMILERTRKLALTIRACQTGNLKRLKDMYPAVPRAAPPKWVVLWDRNGSPVIRKNGRVERRYGHIPFEKVKLDEAHKLWLEYRYGWTPLVHDIEDSLKAIFAQSLRNDLTAKTYYRATGRKGGTASNVSNLTPVTKDGGTFTGTATLTHSVSVKAYAKYQVVDEAGVMNRLNDFGAFDVPRFLWEVTPYSFVIDWFVPIGDWLGAITPKVGVRVIDSGVTTFTEKEVVRKLTGYTPSASGPGQWPVSPVPIGASDSFMTSSKTREIGLPIPLFPIPEVDLNLKRLTDAVALLRSLRR